MKLLTIYIFSERYQASWEVLWRFKHYGMWRRDIRNVVVDVNKTAVPSYLAWQSKKDIINIIIVTIIIMMIISSIEISSVLCCHKQWVLYPRLNVLLFRIEELSRRIVSVAHHTQQERMKEVKLQPLIQHCI